MKPGVHIGEYRIKEQIAVGGFGTVWKAEHVPSGRIAAIKVLHAYLVGTETLVKRFEREARAIALMSHRNIVGLYGQGRLEDGRPYLVMEHLQGVDLGAHIAMRGALLPGEILDILEQLGDALMAAHAQGIIHRDLKASNVFLSERDGALRVVLFDFGIAKLVDRSDSNLTASSSLVGSPACMSPEQILGHPVDARTDVYALGALTYQMLVGHPPFSGASPTAILTMHLDDDPPYPSLHGDVSPAFDDVVMKAMNKSPAERFPHVAEFLASFRAAVEASSAERPQAVPAMATAGETMLALGLYIDVGADPDALEEPEEALLDDLDAVVPEAIDLLVARGYLVAYERNTSALLVRPVAGEDTDEAALRREEIVAALDLHAALDARAGRHERVRVRVYLHRGEIVAAGADVLGGSLLDARDWARVVASSGVFASTAMLAGLDLATEPVAPSLARITLAHGRA